MRETVKLAVRLMIFALCAALMLAVVNELTKDKIEKNILDKQNSSRSAVIGDYDFVEADIDLSELKYVRGAYKAMDGESLIGYVYELGSKGYGGEISLSLGIDVSGNVVGISISNHSETKGLGSASEAPFLSAFNGLKAGQDDAMSIDAMSGATVSSNAIRRAVNEALSNYAENFAGEAVSE